jgi:rhomboid protease GluP
VDHAQAFTDPVPAMSLRFNAPTSLWFSLLCLIVFVTGLFVPGIHSLFIAPGAGGFSARDPLDWVRLVSHVAGHASWDHLIGNLSFILLLGPILEEKYGSGPLAFMILITALIIGALNVLLLPTALHGASGIVFMCILLASFTNARSGEIPVTFILVAVLYLSREVMNSMHHNQISQFAHLLGGACGSLFGFFFNGKR